MGVSDVRGLNRFAQYMEGLQDCYAIIGGTACDVLLSDADLEEGVEVLRRVYGLLG